MVTFCRNSAIFNKYIIKRSNQLEYSQAFFQKVLLDVYKGVEVISVEFISSFGEPGVAALKSSSADNQHLYGLSSYSLTFKLEGETQQISILVKTKTSALMLLDMYSSILEHIQLDLPQPIRRYLSIWLEAWQRDLREIEIYKFTQGNPIYKKYLPKQMMICR